MPRQTEQISLPSPAPGTDRALTVHRWGRPNARPKAYFHAGIHAGEWPGMLALNHLTTLLDAADARSEILGQVVLLPIANPIGLDQGINDSISGRYALMDGGGNFNRGWPDLGPIAEGFLAKSLPTDASTRQAIRDAVAELGQGTELAAWRKALLSLSADADLVFDVHCDSESLMHLFGPAAQADMLAELAADISSPVNVTEDCPGVMPFDQCNSTPWRYLSTAFPNANLSLGCFAVTVELRGTADVRDDLAKADAAGLYRFLQRRGVVAGDPGPLQDGAGPVTGLDALEPVKAPHTGLVVHKVDLGARVKAGDIVAELVDLLAADPTTARTPLKAGTDGLLFARSAKRLARPGQTVFKIAGSASLAHRQGNLLEN